MRIPVILVGLSCALSLPSDAISQVAEPSARAVSPTERPDGLTSSDWSSLRSAYDAARHRVQAVDGGHRARNPAQQWTTRFDGYGFSAQPDAGEWTWGLQLLRYGFAGQERARTEPLQVVADGPRVAYAWDETLTEWFINDARGLEHGFTIHQRPVVLKSDDGQSPLSFLLGVRGPLTAEVQSGGYNVHFLDDGGAAVVTYSGLTVFDADGRDLPARFEHVTEGLLLTVDERGARYPLTIDPIAEQAYLKASTAEAGDQFGFSVTVSGDTVVVGAPDEASIAVGIDGDEIDNTNPGSGAAYVFVRSGTVWSQQAYLKASNSGGASGAFFQGDRFGFSVSLSGETLVVGAPNEASVSTGINGIETDDTAQWSGAAYVFVRTGTVWTQEAYLKASNTGAGAGAFVGDEFGRSVSVSGDTVVVGAWLEDSVAIGVDGDQLDDTSFESGAAYVFVRAATVWTQQAYLKASNTETDDRFGETVAVSGDTVVVGARLEDSSAIGVNGDQADNLSLGAGAVYVFVRSGILWTQEAYLKASNTDGAAGAFPGDHFGSSLTVSGDTVVVGAPNEASAAAGINGDETDNSAQWTGAAYVFTRAATVWSQQAYLKASNAGIGGGFFIGDEFGTAVSLSGDTLVVGARYEDSLTTGVDGDQADNSSAESGAAYVFARSGTAWSQQAYLKASNTETDDRFGSSVALSGETLVVGAFAEDLEAGAAYVFDLVAWQDLGGGSTGINGQPTLVMSGPLSDGSLLHIDLTQAPANALMLIRASLSSTPINAVGGTLYANPFVFQLLLAANVSGAFALSTVVGPGALPGQPIYFQFIVQDASSIYGITLSNAATATTP